MHSDTGVRTTHVGSAVYSDITIENADKIRSLLEAVQPGAPLLVGILMQMAMAMAHMSRKFQRIDAARCVADAEATYSGTAAGAEYGVAKNATIIAVKVLGDDG